ncbi:MAG: OsmC family protein [Saprospiraceae bacterium]|jgi:putative redox protein|nr:OsmC family protein [Saprospiraceae bacterium]MBP6447173.1 OsmC family protein [Saprospiraceae bacterium]
MKIVLESTYGDMNFKGTNERGQSIQLSGNKEAVSPMESVLMAAAACSSIDVEMILKKMRQDVESIVVTVDGTRSDAIPAVFTKMHLHYIITGKIKEDKAIKAVEMSMQQYCSVSLMLAKSVDISHSVEVIIPGLHEQS